MTTKCIELEYPHDGRRKATIVTNDENICEFLSINPDAKLGIFIMDVQNGWIYRTDSLQIKQTNGKNGREVWASKHNNKRWNAENDYWSKWIGGLRWQKMKKS